MKKRCLDIAGTSDKSLKVRHFPVLFLSFSVLAFPHILVCSHPRPSFDVL
jgi:hypothetical protein